MKLTLISLFLCISAAFATNANSQTSRVSVFADKIPAKNVIAQIEEQTDYLFVYNYENVDLSRNVTVSAVNVPVAEVLAKTFEDSDVIYAMEGNNILLMKRNENLEILQNMKRITGTVTDANGEPVIGASIAVKGTKEGTVSNAEGKFSLTVAPDAKLVISYLGYISQELTVGNQADLKIALIENLTMLEDVVVVGYGTRPKETLTGAVASIDSKNILTTKTGNVQNALTGKIAGVKVTQGTSEPGNFGDADTPNAMQFSIRGLGSPLIVIDGVPRDNIMRLDQNEIESISILKDGSAAIYGTRAANGVVLITTKKGARGEKFHFDYTGYAGGQRFLYVPDLMDARQVMEMSNEMWANNPNNAGGSPSGMPYQPVDFEEYTSGRKTSTDWWSPYINDFPLQTQHSLSASGGSDIVDYFVNFGYYNQEGMWKVKSSKYERFNLRSNVTARLAKGLKADVLLNLMQDDRLRQPEGTWRIYRGILEQSPLRPYYYNDDPSKPIQGSPQNRLDIEKDGYWRFKESLVQTNLALEYEIPWVKGLKAKGMYSLDYKVDDTKLYRKGYMEYNLAGTETPGTYTRIERYYDNFQNTLLQLSLNYAAKIKEHNLSLLALYEESDRSADNIRAWRDPMLIDVIDQLSAGDPSRQRNEANPANLFHYTNKGLVGRLTYDYASKYLVDFSFRYDGSSRFGPGHQWGFFPSVSAGWRLSEEGFIKNNIAALNNLKLRGSYGILGDDGQAAYQFYRGYIFPSNSSGDVTWGRPNFTEFDGKQVSALLPSGTPNPILSWIKSKTTDLGLDFDLWNGLLGGTVDVYRRDREGLLATRAGTLPGEVGMTMPQENLNSDRTQGYELTLTHRNKINKDFSYNVSANFSFNRTKAKYVERAPSRNSYRNWRENMNDRWTVYNGSAFSTNPNDNFFWGVGYLGQYTSFADIYNGPIYDGKGNSSMLPGDLIYEDWNEDGVIDDYDRHPIHNRTLQRPFITYGFSVGAEWKGFDLNLVFNGVGKSYIRYDGNRRWYEMAFASGAGNSYTALYDRWHRADLSNPSPYQEWVPGYFPSGYTSNNRGFVNDYHSDFWVQNSAYLRLKSLELGYTLPAVFAQKAKFDTARIFFTGYNLLTFSKSRYTDPERTAVGDENTMYPVAQTLSIGLNLSF
jgi:TonB-linked SusC/RagA family outer membrane protein